jgi:nitroimidazol reductase NimA-like FMN-containing flavoprotein (pyridoxamine 5'-phosphate oxidase superfamily)
MSGNQAIDALESIEAVLRGQTMGLLGLCRDGLPYVVPITYGYVPGRVLMHCALVGLKLEYLRANPQVCFTVARQSGEVVRHPQGADCPVDWDSVICYGTARVVEELDERRALLNEFNRCLQPQAPDVSLDAASGCYAIEITLSHMTGRRQRHGGERTSFAYSYAHDDRERCDPVPR